MKYRRVGKRYGRMGLLLALFLGLTLGTTSFAAVLPGPPAVAGPTADLARLLGTWDCTGDVAGSSSTETYTRTGDDAVAMGNAVHTSSGAKGFVSETFRFTPQSHTWTVTALPNRFFDELSATSAPWSAGTQWVLLGTEVFRKKPMAVRIVYTSLDSDTFRREHQVEAGGMWRDDAAYVCRRVGEMPVAAATASLTPAIGIVAAVSPAPSPPAPLGTPLARVAVSKPWAFAPWRFGVAPAPSRAAQATERTQGRVAVAPSAAPAPPTTLAPKRGPIAKPSMAPVAIATPNHTAAPLLSVATKPVAALTGTAVPKRSDELAHSAAPQRTAAPAARSSPPGSPSTPTQASAAPKRTAAPKLALAPKRTPAPTLALAPKRTAAPKLALAPQRSAAHKVALAPQRAQPADHAFSLVGTWACRTLLGDTSTHVYTLDGNDALALRNRVTIGGRTYDIEENYRFDPAHADWENVTAGGAYRGTAPRWLGSSWTFDGVENEGHASDVRMTYTALGNASFRRDFARERNGAWIPYLSETCRRT